MSGDLNLRALSIALSSIPTALTSHPFPDNNLAICRGGKGGNKSLKGGTNGSKV